MFRRNLQCVIFSGIIVVPALVFAQPPGRGGAPGGMRGGPPTEMILQLFQRADANKDGSVTKAELTAAMKSQARGRRQGQGGPPPQQGSRRGGNRGPAGPPREGNGPDRPRPGQAEHGHQGPPPQPGQVLPEPVAKSLNLDKQQTQQLKALQADVDKRLAAILTDKQKEQLKNARPPHGPSHGEGKRGERSAGRPQRAERPDRPE